MTLAEVKNMVATKSPAAKAFVRVSIEVGALRRSILSDLKRAAFTHGVGLEIKPFGGGWLSKSYGVEMAGTCGNLLSMLESIDFAES